MKKEPKNIKSGMTPNKLQRRPGGSAPKPVVKPVKKPMPRGR